MGVFALTLAAKNDLRGIARFTEERWGRAQRLHYLKGLDETFKILADSPRLGNPCDYIEPDLRKHPFQSHVVFYNYRSEEEIQVIRVLHKNMDTQYRMLLRHSET
ncbi:plasmid stabilization protein ParE [Acidithiobacillus thiooxidans]|uniref:Toxin n=1 Tax=Acidithiobacillus thiooxidans TaxID=930 RepID=A0A1C2JEQ6_ACITH|nr:type II toxin-antitoxin system RelE/ParE family toxin [Acidithiobacillus thiooxidans]OCX71353.1 plasmid stabilization protein ParE [Acidithiobacillus thiooxidans]OCX72015.1 plasmid stabilization protein ParE [Acidithiobacillus thiooxidans]OCX74102.1 plasmid stabilization protein ParE [Acidithiobacillus thiooxidans]OCX81815.1 plasmid stabilization protein ParE [Acidithiobacillus thiooxidans]OCX86675.1 plasmid stabilization protein ParE [Acidithiobacillus thiooxidans]